MLFIKKLKLCGNPWIDINQTWEQIHICEALGETSVPNKHKTLF